MNDLFIRVFLKDRKELVYPEKIKHIDPMRKRANLTHNLERGDKLFSKMEIMRCTGLRDSDTKKLIYELDRVKAFEKDKEVEGVVIFIPRLAAMAIDLGNKIISCREPLKKISTDEELIELLGEEDAEETAN